MIGRWHAAALAVVVVANAAALVQVARDRRDPPHAALWLTERELRLEEPQLESSLLFVRLTWADEPSPEIFGEGTLRALGFDCSVPVDRDGAPRHYGSQPARHAWLLFEYEGKAWTAWREGAGGEPRPANATRLFPVALGADAEATRARCAEPARCLLLPVLVRARVDQPFRAAPRLGAFVAPLTAGGNEIAVPTRLRGAFADVPARPPRRNLEPEEDLPPRYRARLVIGRSYLPRLEAMERLPAP